MAQSTAPGGAQKRDLSSPEVWRRSLGRARSRRVFEEIVHRRRRRRRGSGVSLAMVALLGLGATTGAGLAAGQGGSQLTLSKGSSGNDVVAVQQALGVGADGVYGAQTRNAVEQYQRREGLLVDGIAGPQTRAALGVEGPGSAEQTSEPSESGDEGSDASGSASSPTLERIAECESGGNPRTISPGGHYRGKYQFLRSTWSELGGSGDPAAAPEAEQDRIAAKLLDQSGTAPWGACAG